jgi:hypothetical protein
MTIFEMLYIHGYLLSYIYLRPFFIRKHFWHIMVWEFD